MKRTSVSTWFLIVCLSLVAVQSQYNSKSRPYDPKAEKVTDLHFFLHESLDGQNPTAVVIAQANITTNNSTVPSRTLSAVDDPLRTGPEPSSEVIGNAQGLAVIAGVNSTVAVTYFDFGFTGGEFNGSSLSMFSRNQLTMTEREMSVVGGTGEFRMARGFAIINPYLINATNVILEFNVTVVHY
ncbi:dirigent protein 23-like [Hibiscus syriacus]|uniref:Dirigent protein n=1 Tax=Hibiscus syriacus TaxID=106335 RepID=A0A6A3C840_HIBSY|nr:dirigent protein 4-like [Hibiscus syriacus]KAE8724697.1 dirigent protein 23-like [Hibiscus syriacus]